MARSLRAASLGAALLIGSIAALTPSLASAAQYNVSINDNFFSQKDITVDVGDTVVWKNNGASVHSVKADNGSFDSGAIQLGASYALVFTTPGTYAYHCTFHPNMTGTITVVGGTAPVPTTYVPVQTTVPTYTYTSSPATPNPTVAALQAQAQALLARVQQLQAQLATGGGGTVVPTSGVVLDSSSCPLIGRTLNQGATGEDVTRLQQFLSRDPAIYPEGLVTGYYGPLTEAAVQRWQVKYNIVSSGTPATTGYGQVGPRTAAAIALLCTTGSYGGIPGPTPQSPNVGGYIQVTPVSGPAPLNVAIQATVNTVNSCSGATYTLDYGDGTIPSPVVVPAGKCTQMTQTLGHTYVYGGAYSITLSAGVHHTSATVQVLGAGPPAPAPTPTPTPTPTPNPPPVIHNDSVSAAPASGTAPLPVKFTGYINGSASCNGGSYLLAFGDGDDTTLSYPANGCQAYSYEVTHTYASGGTFTAKLYKGTSSSGSPVANATVTVSGGTTSDTWGIISVTPGVGGDLHSISVQIEYPACAAYSVDWGDSTLPNSVGATSGCSGSTANAALTHTYSGSGNYTVSLKNGSGAVKATAGVTII